MNGIRQIFIAAGLLLILFACSPLKKLETTQTSAYSAFENGNFSEALVLYEQLMQLYKENNKDVPVEIKTDAGKSAFEVKDYKKAIKYFQESFDENKNIEILMSLIDSYKYSSDTEGLKSVIESNIELLKESGKNDFAETELFKINYSLDNFEAAYTNYSSIDTPDEDLFVKYLDVLDRLDKKKEAEKLCRSILTNNKNNIAALKWLAIDKYTRAENWYKRVMAKYNKNKNATTYAYLRRDLKKISVMFRSSRDKFVKLRTMDSENKQYIRYLKNCYLRLDMKDKAAEMDELLK